ncbi:hypothetical protein [Polymorphospora sp. NPDC050346]|uniref:hypothetical protein n=1 Tax=Polymorphospora sp. NPDC050346 TaxID=3155780 RepID=UPI0033C9480A
MADHDNLDLDHQFAAFRNEIFHQVLPAGPTAVRSAVRRHRRRVAVTTGAALALVLVAGPIAGYAALNPESAPRPEPGVSVSPTEPSTPLPLTPTPTPTPSDSASPSSAPNGRISRAELLKSKIDLPPWQRDFGCKTSQARLVDHYQTRPANLLREVAYGDIDQDGATETLAIVQCMVNQGGPVQVIALDRDARGRITTVGRVVRTGTGGIDDVLKLDPRADGSIRIEVSDYKLCCGQRAEWLQRQWRTYALVGAEFVQTGGPASFGPHPSSTDLRLMSVSDVTFEERPDDPVRRYGSITVTIRNAGPTAANVRLDLQWGTAPSGPVIVMANGDGWSACTERYAHPGLSPKESPSCGFRLGVGQQRTLVLGLTNGRTLVNSGVATASIYATNAPIDRALDDNEKKFNFR